MWNCLYSLLHYGPQICQRATPQSPYAPLYAALVCGVPLKGGAELGLFLDAGLIHILVVSGAHLIFVERLTKWIPERPRIYVLAVYCWLTGFGAPVVRALNRRLWSRGLSARGFTGVQIEALSTLMLVILWPPWLWSRSFQMSWLCALALQAPWEPFRWKHLNLSLRCYLFLFPLCPSSPLVIGWNALVGPVIGELLFPLSVACYLIHPLSWFGDVMWGCVLWILRAGPHSLPPLPDWPVASFWWVPLAVHLVLLIGDWKWRRALAFLPSP